jgi:D-methionine transport system ATP-binding protein
VASLLRVENLAYNLPYRAILQPLSFRVAAGEMVLMIGASGAGKTLLLRLLNRLTEPSGGSVYLAERDYRLVSLPQLRGQIALVSAEPNLLGMTVQEALWYPLQLQRLAASEMEQRLGQLLSQMQIPESWLSLRAAQLSIEQCQVVSLARSLILHPRVLLWDEPTKYLDEKWLQLVQSIALTQEMAVVATDQRVDSFTGRALYLAAGQLVWEQSQVNWNKVAAEMEQAKQKELADW